MAADAYRVHAEGTTNALRRAIATPDFSSFLVRKMGTVTRLAAQYDDPSTGRWFAFIGDPNNPDDLADSSQGQSLPSWSPGLVNGQPMRQGDQLSIVALDGPQGSKIVVSCYLVIER